MARPCSTAATSSERRDDEKQADKCYAKARCSGGAVVSVALVAVVTAVPAVRRVVVAPVVLVQLLQSLTASCRVAALNQSTRTVAHSVLSGSSLKLTSQRLSR